MAEYCLDCFNELLGTKYRKSEVELDVDFCEGCGEWKPCVVSTARRGLLGWLLDWLFELLGR